MAIISLWSRSGVVLGQVNLCLVGRCGLPDDEPQVGLVERPGPDPPSRIPCVGFVALCEAKVCQSDGSSSRYLGHELISDGAFVNRHSHSQSGQCYPQGPGDSGESPDLDVARNAQPNLFRKVHRCPHSPGRKLLVSDRSLRVSTHAYLTIFTGRGLLSNGQRYP